MSTLYYHPRRGGKATKVAANRLAVLDTIRERADAATPGPWKVTWDGENDPDGAWSAEWPWLIRQDIYPGKSVANLAEVEASTEDAEFIAHARTDIPVLLAHIDALEASLSALLDSAAHGQPGGYIEFDPNFPERRYCTYCGESWGINSQEWHDADCPVARARALLSE